MGQLFFTDQNGRCWMCGWDNPTQGYYASRENDKDDPCLGCREESCTDECQNFMNDWQDFDIFIGFGKGQKLHILKGLCAVSGWELTDEQVELLKADRARQERPLTPLQKTVKGWLDPIIEDLK